MALEIFGFASPLLQILFLSGGCGEGSGLVIDLELTTNLWFIWE